MARRYRYRTPAGDARWWATLTVQNREALLKAYSPEEALKVAQTKHAACAVRVDREGALMWRLICEDLERAVRAQAVGDL